MIRNPYHPPPQPALTESMRQHLTAMVCAYLLAHAERAEIPEQELRDVHPLLADDEAWATVKAACRL